MSESRILHWHPPFTTSSHNVASPTCLIGRVRVAASTGPWVDAGLETEDLHSLSSQLPP